MICIGSLYQATTVEPAANMMEHTPSGTTVNYRQLNEIHRSLPPGVRLYYHAPTDSYIEVDENEEVDEGDEKDATKEIEDDDEKEAVKARRRLLLTKRMKSRGLGHGAGNCGGTCFSHSCSKRRKCAAGGTRTRECPSARF